MSPLVSVIMPAFNAEKYIEGAINCILSQTHKNIELLIVNDCSNDETGRIIKSFDDPRVKFYENDANLGVLRSCNFLASKASGDFIGFQDADDLSDPRRIEKQLNYIKSTGAQACGTNVQFIDDYGKKVSCRSYPESHSEIIDWIKKNQISCFCGSSVIFESYIYADIGLYDIGFDRIGSEDIDWLYRLAKRYKIVNLQSPLYFYRNNMLGVSKRVSFEQPLKFYSEKIAHELYLKGFYDLGKERDAEILKLKNKFVEEFESDQSVYIEKVIFNAALRNDKAEILRIWFDVIKRKYLVKRKRPLLFRSFLYILVGHSLLSRIRSMLRLSR